MHASIPKIDEATTTNNRIPISSDEKGPGFKAGGPLYAGREEAEEREEVSIKNSL